jgi:hypothetical protein
MDATNRETKFQELIYAQNFILDNHLLIKDVSAIIGYNANSYISTLTHDTDSNEAIQGTMAETSPEFIWTSLRIPPETMTFTARDRQEREKAN